MCQAAVCKRITPWYLYFTAFLCLCPEAGKKRMAMSFVAIGVQIAKPGTVRRANMWEPKIATWHSYLTYSAGESLKSHIQRSQGYKTKPKSPQMSRVGCLGLVKGMGQSQVDNQRANTDLMHVSPWSERLASPWGAAGTPSYWMTSRSKAAGPGVQDRQDMFPIALPTQDCI